MTRLLRKSAINDIQDLSWQRPSCTCMACKGLCPHSVFSLFHFRYGTDIAEYWPIPISIQYDISTNHTSFYYLFCSMEFFFCWYRPDINIRLGHPYWLCLQHFIPALLINSSHSNYSEVKSGKDLTAVYNISSSNTKAEQAFAGKAPQIWSSLFEDMRLAEFKTNMSCFICLFHQWL